MAFCMFSPSLLLVLRLAVGCFLILPPPSANPFSRDVEGTRRNIAAYKVLTLLSFILQFATAVCYMHHAFVNSKSGRHVNPFSLSHVFVSIYWVVLWILQVVYIWHLFRRDETAVNSAAAVGSYFIL